jgi:D-beta-D-heptose 7-phosphate kinase/D-beta-D-heptose 1-phosphate adenosyltransferase
MDIDKKRSFLSDNPVSDLLIEHITMFPMTKALVIGDIIMDEYIWGEVSRISPEAPVPVVDVKKETKMLGGAANVINNMVALGATPVLCGVVGKDAVGEEIVGTLRQMGLVTEGIIFEENRPTTVKTRVVAHSQQIVRFDRENARYIKPQSEKKLLQFIDDNLDGINAIVVSDYGKGVISSSLMKGLRRLVGSSSSVVIAVDPKTENFEYYQGVDVITPNHHEAGAFCHLKIVNKETLIMAGKMMLNDLNCRSVLITQGSNGMTLFENGGNISHIPTVAKKVFDVTGAGDTVIATFSIGLASGLDLKSAALLSNFAAGIVVGEVGTTAVRSEELKNVIAEESVAKVEMVES